MSKVKVLKVDYYRKGFFLESHDRFEIEYEVKKCYWFGKSKVKQEVVNVEEWKSKAWFNHMKNKIGVWESR